MTRNHRTLESAVRMSSLIPSQKYSCSLSSLMLLKASTAMAGRSETTRAGAGSGSTATGRFAGELCAHSPTKRKPLRAMAGISLWALPSSSTAFREALTRLPGAEPEMIGSTELLMSQVQSIGPEVSGSRVFKVIAFLYGMASYLIFFATILYAIGFVMGLIVPKSIDTGTDSSVMEAMVINLLLIALFAVQRSVMARQRFKAWWTRYVPKPIERSTYVLLASLCLLLLFWQWRPITKIVWQVDDPGFAVAIATISLAGWRLVFTSTFLINHFELFGLSQVTNHLVDKQAPPLRFLTPLFYKFVRHPLYLGFIIAFCAAPAMTAWPPFFSAG